MESQIGSRGRAESWRWTNRSSESSPRIPRLARVSAALHALLLCLGCMATPHDGALVDDLQPIEFGGVAAEPDALVTVKAATRAAGPFATWDGSTTRSAASVSGSWRGA